MVANSAAVANSRLSQSPSEPDRAQPSFPDAFAIVRGSYFSRMRVQLGAAVAKAAAVRFLPDNVSDDLPLRIHWEMRSPAGGAAPLPDLPLYHALT